MRVLEQCPRRRGKGPQGGIGAVLRPGNVAGPVRRRSADPFLEVGLRRPRWLQALTSNEQSDHEGRTNDKPRYSRPAA